MAKTTAFTRYENAHNRYKAAKSKYKKAKNEREKATALKSMNKALTTMSKQKTILVNRAYKKYQRGQALANKFKGIRRKNPFKPKKSIPSMNGTIKKEFNLAKARAKQMLKNLPDEIQLFDVLKDLNEIEGLKVEEKIEIVKNKDGKDVKKKKIDFSITDEKLDPKAISESIREILPGIQKAATQIQKSHLAAGEKLSRKDAMAEAMAKWKVDYYTKDLWSEYARMKKIADQVDLQNMLSTKWHKDLIYQGGYYKDHGKFKTDAMDWRSTSDSLALARSAISAMFDKGVALQEKKKQAVLSGTDLF